MNAMIYRTCPGCGGNLDPGEICTDCAKRAEEQAVPPRPARRLGPYERTRVAVYATGNQYAIENFHATHD